jgi:hypothetical protein
VPAFALGAALALAAFAVLWPPPAAGPGSITDPSQRLVDAFTFYDGWNDGIVSPDGRYVA